MTGPRLRQPAPSTRDVALARADARLAAAREKFSTACAACLAGRMDSDARIQDALQAVDQARAELARLADVEADE
ncbi:MAG: hypothetical protein HYY78_01885 [Betaproteobacteria bacterium]|nr:hypothetical protein [Betaproteobacteria bacterium]